jgi:hypothetical protein
LKRSLPTADWSRSRTAGNNTLCSIPESINIPYSFFCTLKHHIHTICDYGAGLIICPFKDPVLKMSPPLFCRDVYEQLPSFAFVPTVPKNEWNMYKINMWCVKCELFEYSIIEMIQKQTAEVDFVFSANVSKNKLRLEEHLVRKLWLNSSTNGNYFLFVRAAVRPK